jgi:transcriptional regulator with XRE-family HTH domain
MNKIKEVLQLKGIKQKWLSEKVGKSLNVVNDYCNNRRQPSLEVLYRIADILEVDITDLLEKSNKR